MLVGMGNGTPLTEPKVNEDNDTRLRHNHRTGRTIVLRERAVGSQLVREQLGCESERLVLG